MGRSLVPAALAILLARRADAQALVDDGYVIDVVDLPVLASSRAVGLGGAYGAVGEGITGVPFNPASPAARAPHERDWFEWELGLGALFPTAGSSTRVFGNTANPVRTDSFSYFDAGMRFQFGPAAVGIVVRPRRFTYVNALGDTQKLTSQIGHVDFAWTFNEGEYTAGIGVRALHLDIEADGVTQLDVEGAGFELGFLARPIGRPYRYAVALRGPVRADDVTVDPTADALIAVPSSAVAPMEVSLSGAYAFGERPFNPPRAEPERPRDRRARERRERFDAAHTPTPLAAPDPRAEDLPSSVDPAIAGAPGAGAEAVAATEGRTPGTSSEAIPDSAGTSATGSLSAAPEPRRYGFVSAELVIVGATARGVGLDGFLSQTNLRWGRHPTVSVRVGIEGEPWRDRMKLRTGLYVESARPSASDPRVHVTGGFDLRLFSSRFFFLDEPIGVQVGFTSDVAVGYLAFGIGVGVWH